MSYDESIEEFLDRLDGCADSHVMAWMQEMRDFLGKAVPIETAWGETHLDLVVDAYHSFGKLPDKFYLYSPSASAIKINDKSLANEGGGYFTIERAVLARDGIPSVILVDGKEVPCDTATYWDYKKAEKINDLAAVNNLLYVALNHPYLAY